MLRFILASGSPRRSEILTQMGIKFEVIKSGCSEEIEENISPSDAVVLLSERKADDVIKRLENDYNKYEKVILISADTVVSLDNKILGKPKDEEDAFETLKMLRGKTHNVYTGMCVSILTKDSKKNITNLTQSKVTFKNMTDEEIKGYIKTGEPMDKAGSYAIQGIGASFIEKAEGDFFSVIGLSMSKLYDILKENSIEIF